MDHASQLRLMDELRALKNAKTAYLDSEITHSPTIIYQDDTRFRQEEETIFRQLPHGCAHESELPGPGAFIRRDIQGLPLLLTRDEKGKARAFLNVCRHRGARLVEEQSGCKRRFICPYHAWTYANSGELVGAPHFSSGFPGMEKQDIRLSELPTAEAFGLIWVVLQPEGFFDFDDYFAPLADELTELNMADMHIAMEDELDCAANWKIIIEGGIESYHFRTAHRATIAPYFEDNLSTYQCFGPHIRSILPRTSMAELAMNSRGQWRLRDHANLIYTLFPTTQFLVQQDHVIWISSQPVAPNRTVLRLATLAPRHGSLAEGREAEHWRQNHHITMKTLNEDFAIAESIQAGLASGANHSFIFGRFEGALARFHETIERHIG
ncbi:aromatic ring-hydroxylating oxygenase subunit alpha [Sphingopyxis sp. MWB1]|uniref:aromatic ring-hydroxylating oxygenase subunit alpha n=1 Tax=Sphingopyxis sp. MWB1 TaxID=1537715 RepID=UPI00051A3938|nr:SRPBCC family protein [Sphingopyxis sp. MWB1]